MKRLLIICSLVALLVGATVFDAGAVLITGGIGFSGKVTPNTGSLATATSISFTGFTTNAGPTGNFAAVPAGTAVTVVPLVFTPFAPAAPWWSFASGGNTFGLNTTGVTMVNQTSSFLNILGTGMATETGFDPTLYNWSATATVALGGIDFTGGISNASVPVPPSVLILASGLIGLVAIRRRVGK